MCSLKLFADYIPKGLNITLWSQRQANVTVGWFLIKNLRPCFSHDSLLLPVNQYKPVTLKTSVSQH